MSNRQWYSAVEHPPPGDNPEALIRVRCLSSPEGTGRVSRVDDIRNWQHAWEWSPCTPEELVTVEAPLPPIPCCPMPGCEGEGEIVESLKSHYIRVAWNCCCGLTGPWKPTEREAIEIASKIRIGE